jgi:hypothetical protein
MIELKFPITLKNTIASAPNGAVLNAVTTISDGGWFDNTSVHYTVNNSEGDCVAVSESLLFTWEAFDKESLTS